MEKFEYKVETFFNHELKQIKTQSYLNEQGQNGWELVNLEIRYATDQPTEINRRRFYFKRKL